MRAEWTKYSESERVWNKQQQNLSSLSPCSKSVSLFQDEEVFSLVQNWAPMLNCLLGCKKWHLTAEITRGMMKDHHYQSGHVWKSNMSRRQFHVSCQPSHRRHSGCAMLYHPIYHPKVIILCLHILSSIHASNMAFLKSFTCCIWLQHLL